MPWEGGSLFNAVALNRWLHSDKATKKRKSLLSFLGIPTVFYHSDTRAEPCLPTATSHEGEIGLYKAKVTLLYFLNDRLTYCDHVFNSLVLK